MMDHTADVFWYNYKADEYQAVDPTTDEIALNYLPQNLAAERLYRLYRESGKTILQAMIEVLTAAIGEEATP